MEYRRLGRSGLKVSVLSFGVLGHLRPAANHQGNGQLAADCLGAAYDAGVNFFDNAEAYAQGKAEVVMGEILKAQGWPRDEFVVSSKVFWGGDKPNQQGLCRKHVVEACHAALRRLQVDYLDLYFCHRPDPETPIEETVRAMTDLIRQGKVLYWGTSEWSADQISEAYNLARQYGLETPTMEQPQYNMFHREKVEREFAPLYGDIGLGHDDLVAAGQWAFDRQVQRRRPRRHACMSLKNYEWLKESMTNDEAKKRLETVKALAGMAAELGTNLPRLALAWCLRNPHVSTVITGASRVEQLQDNMGALDVVKQLTPEVLARIEGLLSNKP